MSTVLEKTETYTAVREDAAALHNAQIRERYERLRNLEADQLAQYEEERAQEMRASVLAPERPATRTVEQTPSVTKYTRTRGDYALFTPETLDRAIENNAVQNVSAPVQAMPVIAVTQETAVETEAQYSLSSLAKKVLVAFAMVVIALLSIIAVNTRIINQKRIKIEKLEQQRERLQEDNEDLQLRIQNATSEETMRQYAQENGMIQIPQ